MSSKNCNDNIIKKARKEVWNIVTGLLDHDVDVSTIQTALAINCSEIEELKSERNVESIRIAINLAKEAKGLNLTAEG
ncbi:hypothetical protein [Oceanobacillus kimchii]|uniref:hypothetical protein n=1 Tax=Oceanobacillus kimchii TaxID=746691 RepID=UPI003B02D9FB